MLRNEEKKSTSAGDFLGSNKAGKGPLWNVFAFYK